MLTSLVTVVVGFTVAAFAMLYLLDWRIAQVVALTPSGPNRNRRSPRSSNAVATRRETRSIRERIDVDR